MQNAEIVIWDIVGSLKVTRIDLFWEYLVPTSFMKFECHPEIFVTYC